MTITPTIRPEIKKENERQRKQMYDNAINGKRLKNSAFDQMLKEELEKVKSKLPKEWIE